MGMLVLGFSAAAQAQDAPAATSASTSTVDVVKVDGLLDPVLTSFVRGAIADAEASRSTALVLQINLDDAVVDDGDVVDLVQIMQRSAVPVNLWIGPSGSHLLGKATNLVFGASLVGMAPGTKLGPLEALADGGTDTLAAASPLTPAAKAALATSSLGATEAKDLGITAFDAPVIGDFFVNLPGVEVNEVTEDGQTRRQPVTQVRFGQLSLLDNFMHTVASPAVAYLLLTAGLALIVFELFTAGVGVAGVIGAVCTILAFYGLAVLPTRPLAIVAIVLALVAFAIDVQTGVPRFWTAAGVVLYVVGSFTLYDGVSMSWLTMVVGIVSMLLTFLSGMPSMVRTRFSMPTIGREWMVGEMGRAVSDVSPDGVVEIRGAQWRAYTNRATPIEALDRVRVTGIEGLVLEVEPEAGGARDYRERGPKKSATADETPSAE
jgi:membrane-bound serine protease (ClpP class)